MFTSLGDKFKEIDEYWDSENQYIKDSGIYTPEEVEQILANHEEIRRNQREITGYEGLGTKIKRGVHRCRPRFPIN